MIRTVSRREPWIELRVDWLASPQGSHFSPRKGVVRESNTRTEPYRQAVAEACDDYIDKVSATGVWQQLDGPLEASISFHLMPPPKGDPDRRYPHVPPDLDKLIRATFDGITRGGLWKDDARVCRLSMVEKIHAPTPEETHVIVRVRPL